LLLSEQICQSACNAAENVAAAMDMLAARVRGRALRRKSRLWQTPAYPEGIRPPISSMRPFPLVGRARRRTFWLLHDIEDAFGRRRGQAGGRPARWISTSSDWAISVLPDPAGFRRWHDLSAAGGR
jgi:hypothetical protein